jgi:pyruvate formate lyase activating enzyme
VKAMTQLGMLSAGSRHTLRLDFSPDAPDESDFEDTEGKFGFVHSYETASLHDGPGLRVVLFMSGCLLRCSYCHNPDTWHLKDGTYISAQHVIDRLGAFASALRSLNGGLTISGGEPLVQIGFTRRILAAAKQMRLHTSIETSGYLGDKVDNDYLKNIDLVLLDIKSWDPETYRRVTGRELAPTLFFAERLARMGKPVWVRFTLVPGLTDEPDNVEGLAQFVAPMKNVKWVEVQPFHQLGAFKWRAMNLDYKHVDTPPPTRELVDRVLSQFRSAGCNAR